MVMSTETDVRAARTESLFRGVNERIAEVAGRFGANDASFVCECGDADCTHRVRATLDEYEYVRTDGAQFLMVEEHADPEIERVTGRNRRFALVEKVKPLVRETARRLNPRAAGV
jgi:hypothetical protein